MTRFREIIVPLMKRLKCGEKTKKEKEVHSACNLNMVSKKHTIAVKEGMTTTPVHFLDNINDL